jgi:pyruvate, water dikinase
MTIMDCTVAWFKDLPPHSVTLAGGKGASLGDMARAGLPVPPGFVVCAGAFRSFLEANDGFDEIERIVGGLDIYDTTALDRAENAVHDFILSKPLPASLVREIAAAYAKFGKKAAVAVRSSAISEDGAEASFAGQQETFLNVRGVDSVVQHVQVCWASFFTARALFYRANKGSLADTGMAVVVQRMAQPEKSGIMFTVDPVQGRRDHMVIEAIFGLGEAVVSGLVTPDQYVVVRDTGEMVREYVSAQSIAIVRDESSDGTIQIDLPLDEGSRRVLSEDELRTLRKTGLELERYFGKPQDVEWCIENERLFLLQSRPITTL